MMIALSTIEIGASIVINAQGAPGRENTRRLSRSATLDGGCVITDGGLSDGDRTFRYSASQLSAATLDALWAMFGTESLVHLCCAEGVFSGYIEQLGIVGADVSLQFMIYEKLT